MYVNLGNGVLAQDKTYIQTVSGEVSSILSSSTLESETLYAVAKLIRMVGNLNLYRDVDKVQCFFDSVACALTMSGSEEVLKKLVPSFLWSCSKVRYYNQALMSHLEQFILDNLQYFTYKDLNMIVYAYAHLNHFLPGLMSRVEQHLLVSGSLTELQSQDQRLVWTVAWAAMVFMDYPTELLRRILTDDYITGELLCVLSLFSPKSLPALVFPPYLPSLSLSFLRVLPLPLPS